MFVAVEAGAVPFRKFDVHASQSRFSAVPLAKGIVYIYTSTQSIELHSSSMLLSSVRFFHSPDFFAFSLCFVLVLFHNNFLTELAGPPVDRCFFLSYSCQANSNIRRRFARPSGRSMQMLLRAPLFINPLYFRKKYYSLMFFFYQDLQTPLISPNASTITSYNSARNSVEASSGARQIMKEGLESFQTQSGYLICLVCTKNL